MTEILLFIINKTIIHLLEKLKNLVSISKNKI